MASCGAELVGVDCRWWRWRCAGGGWIGEVNIDCGGGVWWGGFAAAGPVCFVGWFEVTVALSLDLGEVGWVGCRNRNSACAVYVGDGGWVVCIRVCYFAD